MASRTGLYMLAVALEDQGGDNSTTQRNFFFYKLKWNIKNDSINQTCF